MLKEYFKDNLNSFQSKTEIQKLTFYPMMFQAARVMRITGILNETYINRHNGIDSEKIASKLNLPHYGVKVLLEVSLTIGLVFLKEEGKYCITKMGYLLLNDKATIVNLNFSHDICYKAMYHLEESIKKKKPIGLKEIGLDKYSTIYPGLSELPEPIKTSWFEFDHYYSDIAFPEALKIVFIDKPLHILDIGGNTGKWSMACCRYDKNVRMTIIDLPGQLDSAKENIEANNLQNRIFGKAGDVLSNNLKLPADFDTIWMSQFLDCFSEEQIVKILTNICNEMSVNTNVFILELFWDRQKDLAAAYCLHGISLYFSAVANGNSKMYHSKDFYKLIEQAGLKVVSDTDHVGEFHTLLKCKKVF